MGPWPLGMDMLSPDDRLPRDESGKNVIAVRDALNINVTREGQLARRPGARRIGTQRIDRLSDLGFAVANGQICRVDGDSLVPIASLASGGAVDFCELNGDVIISTSSALSLLRNGALSPLAAATPAEPQLTAVATGGLTRGRYAVAVSTSFGGVESGLSHASFVDVPEGGGIQIGNLPAGALVYRTQPNGDVLYRAGTSSLLSAGDLGRIAETRFMEPLPSGEWVRRWRGRLVTARGRFLRFSEPMRFGLWTPTDGFVQLPDPIQFFEPVEGGIYVGQRKTVIFLRGQSFDELVLDTTGAAAPVRGSSTLIKPGVLGMDQAPTSDCALWLAENGFVIGMPSGQIAEMQASRIRLSASSGEIAVHDRRVIATIN
ncbi:MAG: hypothetical protein ACRC2H_05625 [Silanimonas sp.]